MAADRGCGRDDPSNPGTQRVQVLFEPVIVAQPRVVRQLGFGSTKYSGRNLASTQQPLSSTSS